jgi:hypothetical protein
MGLHILLALPVIIVPFRRSIEALEMSLVAMWRLWLARRQHGGGSSSKQLYTSNSNSLQVLSTGLLSDREQQCSCPPLPQ